MKLKIVLIVTFFVSLLLTISTIHAYDWSGTSINSGYAVTTNYHGIDIPVGTEVTATAGTTEHPNSSAHNNFPNVTAVRFRWMPPNTSSLDEWYSPLLIDPPKNLTWDGITYYNGWPVYMANDSQTITEIGDWGVQAWFYDEEGNLRNQTGIEKIRATSFNAVPEVPFGTLAIVTVMFGALVVFAVKRKRMLFMS